MKEKRILFAGGGLIIAFALWTALIQCVDVKDVGQNGTQIGFADFNVWFHQLTGVHLTIYTITDWLGLVPIFICMCSGIHSDKAAVCRHYLSGYPGCEGLADC